MQSSARTHRLAPPLVALNAGGRILPFPVEDAPRVLANIQTERDLVQWAGRALEAPLTLEVWKRHVNVRYRGRPGRICLKYCAGGSDAFAGFVELARVDQKHRAATLSKVLIDKNLRGRGLGRRMLGLVLELAYARLKLHRVDLRVYTWNTPALKLYEGLGFKKEGLHRDVVLVNGEYWSEYSLSLLEDEWRAGRQPP